jgi:alcohol dehydrogenase (cytochrome c)
VYWGTGNAGPDYNGNQREGDNLYTASVVALDPDTGKLKWYYQFTPHDVWDWDSTQMPIIADVQLAGQTRKALLFANRNGFYYTLDRATGKVLVSKPYINVSWAKEIGADGRPVVSPDQLPSEEGTRVCPTPTGGTNWMSPAYNPNLGLLFVTANEACGTFYNWRDEYVPGERFTGGGVNRANEKQYAALRAIDPKTGDKRWEFTMLGTSWAGVLSTAADLIFTGASGYVVALDGRTGKDLWRYQTGAPIYAAPITYMLDGKQYVLLPSGTTLTAFALAE